MSGKRVAQRLLRLQESGFIGVWVSWPKEPLEPVFVSAWHDVNVQMRDTLADAVIDRHKRALCSQSLFQRMSNEFRNRKKWRE